MMAQTIGVVERFASRILTVVSRAHSCSVVGRIDYASFSWRAGSHEDSQVAGQLTALL